MPLIIILKKTSQKNNEKALKSTHNNVKYCRVGSDQRQMAKKYFVFVHLLLFSIKIEYKKKKDKRGSWS